MNISPDIQTNIHEEIIKIMTPQSAVKSGTIMMNQPDSLKKDVFSNIINIKEKIANEEFDIDYMANHTFTAKSSGQHPGGVLVKPDDVPFEFFTPLQFASDDPKKGIVTSSYEYHDLENQLPKLDLLGQDTPTAMKDMTELTGIDFRSIKFNDPKMYEILMNPELIGLNPEELGCKTFSMGISELNTEVAIQMLLELKPKNMTDLVYFAGLAHGTNVWNGNIQKEKIMSGQISVTEAFPVRDIIYQHLYHKYGVDPTKAFKISEIVRKGNAKKLLGEYEQELLDKGVPEWMVKSMYQIQYMFPKAHAASYIMMSIRELWYKINTPREFYTMVLNRYGLNKNDNKNFDYVNCYKFIEDKYQFDKYNEQIEKENDNPMKVKNNKRIAHIIWELKLRGFKLKKATFASHPTKFGIDPSDKSAILMPLLSVYGIGEKAAETIGIAYKEYGESLNGMTTEELSNLRLANGTKAFGKKVIEALENY